MRKLRQRLRSERGFALVLALGITVVLSMTVVTVIESTTSNQHASTQSKNRVSAFNLAEAGLNNAMSVLSQSNAYDPHVLHPQPPNQPADCASPPANPQGAPLLGNTCSPIVYNLDGGSVTVSGYFNSGTSNWTITSTGDVRNPFGGLDTTRTITATVHIRPAPSQVNYVTAWNYVFIKDTTPNVCNLTLSNSSNLAVSLYIAGNLCFANSSSIAENPSPNNTDPINLEVIGQIVYLNGSSKGVGDTGLTNNGAIHTAKIGGGCATTSVGHNVHTCASPGDYFYVQSGGYSTTASPISSPNLANSDYTGYYSSAYISRGNSSFTGCGANQGFTALAATAFDNDTTPLNGATGNGSLASAFNLTPSSSYSCQVKDSAGKVIGELDWDNTNKILSVRGTVYIDGDVTATQSGAYRGVNSSGVHPNGDTTGADGIGGQAVIYASGAFSLGNNISLCGWNTATDKPATTNGSVPVNATCTFSAWTPNTSMLMFVTHNGASFNQSSYFQGAIYSSNNVTVGQSSQTDGPMISNTMSIGNSVQMRPLPGINDLPVGAPGNPNTAGIPEAPSYGSG